MARIATVFILFFLTLTFGCHSHRTTSIGDSIKIEINAAPIPLVQSNLPNYNFGEPISKRDTSVLFYLQSSVRINNKNSAGSGTICYYDEKTEYAYVISCAHLFEKSKSPSERSKNDKVQIDVFYKNNQKLSKPESFQSELVCCDHTRDISILKFKPNWKPSHYFAIAPVDYPIRQGDKYESTGCDGAEEVASYTIEITEGMQFGDNLVSKGNSPRPGRSGGGLLTSDGYYIGIVWGTSAVDGSGYGYYVPLRKIHEYLSQYEQTAWLLNVGDASSLYETFPIFTQDGNRLKMPNGYLPKP